MSLLDKTSGKPFYNDFNKDLNFLHIVFDPTRAAVQARELTQVQTILQNQIAQLGGHLLANNSLVYGGELEFNRYKPSAEIELNYFNSSGVDTGTSIDPSSLIGKVYKNPDLSTSMTITHAKIVNNKLYVYYTFTGSNFEDDDLCSPETGTLTYIKIKATAGSVFFSTSVKCNSGIIFRDGFFITIVEQEKIIAHTNTGRISAGYRFEESVINADDPYYGNTLKDPANGSYNYNAPGASRYRILPVLDGFEDDGDKSKIWSIQDHTELEDGRYIQVDDFYQKYREIVVIENGKIVRDFQDPIYGEILKMIARRTYDESGDYTIDDFKVTQTKSSDPDTFNVRVSAGKAYVRGYEIEKLSPTNIEVDRARDYVTRTYGRAKSNGLPYLVLDEESTVLGSTASEQIRTSGGSIYPKFENHTKVRFYNSSDVSIGTGYLTMITRQSSEYRAYFHHIANVTPNINNASYFEIETSDPSNIKFYIAQLDDGIRFFGNGAKPFIYPIDNTIYTKSVSNLEFDTNLEYVITSDGSGNITISRTIGEVEFYDSNNGGVIMIQNTTTGNCIDIDDISATGGNVNVISNATGTPISNNTEYRIIVKARMLNCQARSKVLTTVTDEVVVSSGDNYDILELAKEDVYDIVSIKQVGAGSDYTLTDREIGVLNLDDGQDKFWYDNGSISNIRLVGTGDRTASRTFKVTYRYYEHSAASERSQFFTVNSYATDHGSDLSGIKPFKNSQLTYSLIDSVDFRQKRSELNSGAESNILMPFSSASFSFDTYIPRADRVYVDTTGEIRVQKGISSPTNNPQLPLEIDESMTLATMTLPAYTPSVYSIITSINDNRRYTMRDIGKLEDRIENLEYYTSLSLLEKSANELNVFDANGFDRFKNGIFVDPFLNHEIGNVVDGDYRCVTYPNGGMTCPFYATALEFSEDVGIVPTNQADEFDNLIVGKISGDKSLCSNLTASTCINVNPYLYVPIEGTIKLYPSVDTWTEVRYDEDEVRSGFVLRGTASSSGGFGTNQTQNAQIIRDLGRDWDGWGQWMGLDKNTWVDYANNRWGAQSNQGISGRTGSIGDVNITTTYGRGSGSGTFFSSVSTDRLVGNENAVYARPITVTYDLSGFRANADFTAVLGDTDITLSNSLTDSDGNASGTFDIPEFTIPTGTSLFKLEDESGLATAQTTFQSTGVIERRNRKTIKITWHDPLAQSFLVESVGGAFLKSVDLYVRKKPTAGSLEDYPLNIAIVEMLNGYPTQDQLRYSKVSLPSTSVNASDDIDADSVQSGLTTFTFTDPVYVEEGKEYAIVVSSQSNEYCVWISVLGEQNIFDDGLLEGAGMLPTDPTKPNTSSPSSTLTDSQISAYTRPAFTKGESNLSNEEFEQIFTNRPPTNTSPEGGRVEGGVGSGIFKQPFLGSLFLSQNSSTWTADQMKDLTFNVQQYQFVQNDPSYFVTKDTKQDINSKYSIYSDEETFSFGDVADNATFITARSLSGLTEADIAVTHSVNGVLDAFADPAEYTLDSSTDTIVLTSALTNGQSVIISTKNTLLRTALNQGSTLFLNIGQYVIPGTQLIHKYDNVMNTAPNLTDGHLLDGIELPNRQNKSLSAEIEIDDGVDGHSASLPTEVQNLWLENEFTTANPNISAVIEKEAYRLVLIRNLVIPLNSLDDTDNTTKWDAGAYVSKTVELLDEADDLRVLVDAYLPSSSQIKVYYRVEGADAYYVSPLRESYDKSSNYTALKGKVLQLMDLRYSGANPLELVSPPTNENLCVFTGTSPQLENISTYDAGTNYVVNDTVYFTISSELYSFVCVQDTIGNAPSLTVDTYWQLYDERAYLTQIQDATQFDSLEDGFLVEQDAIDSSVNVPCETWVSGGYAIGDIVIHQGNLWKANIVTTTEVPTDIGTAWTKIPSIRIGGSSVTPVQITSVRTDISLSDWKPMKFIDTTTDTTVAATDFIEFSYEPEVEPTQPFDDFAVKVELISSNKVDMPVIKNLRAIAVL